MTSFMFFAQCPDEEAQALSFQLLPVSSECPYAWASFSVKHQVLKIISKDKYPGFKEYFKTDQYGRRVEIPGKRKANTPPEFQKEFKHVENNFEFYIYDRQEIEAFIAAMVVGTAPNLAKYFKIVTASMDMAPDTPIVPAEPDLTVVK